MLLRKKQLVNPTCHPPTLLRRYDMRKLYTQVDKFGQPYGFQYIPGHVMGEGYDGGYPIYLSAQLPAERIRTVRGCHRCIKSTCLAQGQVCAGADSATCPMHAHKHLL